MSPQSARVVVSIGSNIEPERHIRQALEAMKREFGPLRVSPVYRTSAVGFEGPPFLNLVVVFDAGLAVDEVIKRLRAIEADAGRSRGGREFDSRTLDLDVILFGDRDLRGEGYNIPRKDIERYAFVLEPLADLLPEARHPVLHKRYAELWAEFDDDSQHAERIGLSF